MIKPLFWVGQARKDLQALPEDVQDLFGYALYLAQQGRRHPQARPLKGFGGAGVLEVVEDNQGNTFRAVYTVCLRDAIYVLHVFQKKSSSGIATSRPKMEKIEQRLKAAQRHAGGLK
ncbi:type II toxin-antitoxin system RelE/ParE family toxin [Cronobacter sakazakii]|nr:type II toxin-antitoxin system RelE/ParE family toxin [Cronobacter sakazakii]ELY5882410.1 type II toxin-antitoxin system RelE/ParE family toxin [Cronobacter sakazakii]